MSVVMAFALKRSLMARLIAISEGEMPPVAGSEALAGSGVQCAYVLPAEPDRICVYGTPVRSSRTQTTAESYVHMMRETVLVEIRVRVYQPGGESDEDIGDVDLQTGQICSAVATALLDGEPLFAPGTGSIILLQLNQWPTALASSPEPGVTGLCSLVFQADLVTT